MSENPTIDNGVCTACNCTVTYNEACTDDEVCIRSKPYCTKSDDERVDWRVSCLHATECALKAERERDRYAEYLDDTIRKLTEWCDARIAVCRDQELKFSDGAKGQRHPARALVEAWTERRTAQAVLDMLTAMREP
jgi:hypothetical protein